MCSSDLWSGNIRELKNIIERASIMSENGSIEVHHLPETIRKNNQIVSGAVLDETVSLDEKIKLMEKDLILGALKQSQGIQVKAAALLGINQRSLWHRIKKHDIDVASLKHLQ